jgi:hypothetical protein
MKPDYPAALYLGKIKAIIMGKLEEEGESIFLVSGKVFML